MSIETMRTISITVNIICIIISLLLGILYLFKRKITTKENSIYDGLLISNVCSLILELIFYIISIKNNIFIKLFEKMYFSSNCIWLYLLTVYIWIITGIDKKIFFKNWNLKKKKKIIICIMLILSLLILALPVQNIYSEGYLVSSIGASPSLMFLVSFILIILNIIMALISRKNIKKNKTAPLYLFVLLMLIELVANGFGFKLMLITLPMTLVSFLMYHTIENPDVKTINELERNKLLVEKTFEEKSNFLFKMTQEVKKPINNMKDIITSLKISDDLSELRQGVKLLDANSKQLDFVVNDVLDITTLDAKNIKIVNNRYNVYNLFKDIEKRMEEYASNDVEFRFNIDENIPYLYGDAIKLKQIIMSVLLNSVNKTKSGFIELSVDAIEKYDVCRLIIEIEDSGVGMSIDKINEVMVTTSELSVDDIKNLEKLDINLKLCQKSIKLLGGNLMIRSEENKGTEVIITIDQQIYNKKQTSDLEKYQQLLYNNRKILVVSNKEEDVNLIKKIFGNCAIISNSLYGKDAIDKINFGKKYDLIIIEDELPLMSGLTIMQELRKIDNFKIPVVVMIDKDKEEIKEYYIKDGFDDYILKRNEMDEINKIKEKYL